MFAQMRRGWELTKKAWGVVRSHPSLARLPLTGGFLALVVFLVFGIPGGLMLSADGTANTAVGVVLVGFAWFAASFSVIYYNVALAACANQVMRGEEPDVAAGKRLARSRVGTIAGWALVSVFVSALLGAIRDRGGILGRIAASIGAAIWALITFLVVPVLAFEGIGPIAAIKRSRALLRQRWGQQITGNLVIGGISGLVSFVGFIIAIVGVGVLISGSAVTGVLGGLLIVIGVVIAIGGAVFGGATRGVFGVALYRYAAESQAIGPFTESELNGVVRIKQ